ncbi:nucleoside deaminase [Paenactinomyces guangxiensis]|uniref:Nucleoside deaminase n=1 Tax=Paenactinomyces guangxiensis TaxID=1490290 RepID=A0A7W2A9T9_9BACL|nr:nucleoside deaminase [Paenactinomyces guangxiensis]MBA4495557.1 nucleoside deaminase [Paenactinomyces guangxiensis]MBH8592815.1 nucleoside deaminase [Paenactinomyces guangxiensis]
MNHEHFLQTAVRLARENVQKGLGGPFGAIVVKDGKVIGSGQNRVTLNNDPTAHAEVQAIREACRHLGSFQLEGCTIYSSCEPCPMCIGAIYWARPEEVYFACTKEDAAKANFDDVFIYQELALPLEQRTIAMKKFTLPDEFTPFQAWMDSGRKIEY